MNLEINHGIIELEIKVGINTVKSKTRRKNE